MPVALIHPQRLKSFLVRVFLFHGLSQESAETAADVLIRADVRGVESHGVNNLPLYLNPLSEGKINTSANLEVIRSTPVTEILDAGGGLGLVMAVAAMKRCIEKAKQTGMAMVTVRRSHHFGMAAYYSLMCLEHDLIGVSLTNNSGTGMVPTHGDQPMLSSNPISFAAPTGREAPFVMDFATTVTAMSKLHRMMIESDSGKIPFGWALNPEGHPTNDAAEAVKGRKHLPLGSSPEMSSHKGYGLAVMVDIITGILSGGTYGNLVERHPPTDPYLAFSSSHCFAALNPEVFRPLSDFKRDMDDMLRALKESRKAAGQSRIFTHGEKEHEAEIVRKAEGIPYSDRRMEQLEQLAARLQISL